MSWHDLVEYLLGVNCTGISSFRTEINQKPLSVLPSIFKVCKKVFTTQPTEEVLPCFRAWAFESSHLTQLISRDSIFAQAEILHLTHFFLFEKYGGEVERIQTSSAPTCQACKNGSHHNMHHVIIVSACWKLSNRFLDTKSNALSPMYLNPQSQQEMMVGSRVASHA
jgi:hypothetical protein